MECSSENGVTPNSKRKKSHLQNIQNCHQRLAAGHRLTPFSDEVRMMFKSKQYMELDNDNDLLPAIPTADECSSISGKHIVLHVGDEVERQTHIHTWQGVICGFKRGRCLTYPPAAGFQCNTDFDLESIFITSKSVGNHFQQKIQITQEMTIFCVQNHV